LVGSVDTAVPLGLAGPNAISSKSYRQATQTEL
jgi:hypothetical protein